jgi:hypothetical protein
MMIALCVRSKTLSVVKPILAVLCAWLLTGCDTIRITTNELIDALPDATFVNEESSGKPNYVQATGYAPISLQPGATHQQKVITAMRASKLRAYQELAGVVHGQYVYGTTTVEDMVIQNDRFKSAVAGIVRGARVVKTYPVQDDTYATTLEVDMNQLQQAWILSQQ